MKYILILSTLIVAVIGVNIETPRFKKERKRVLIVILFIVAVIQLIVQHNDIVESQVNLTKVDSLTHKVDSVTKLNQRINAIQNAPLEYLKCDIEITMEADNEITKEFVKRAIKKTSEDYDLSFSSNDNTFNYPQQSIKAERMLYFYLHPFVFDLSIVSGKDLLWTADYIFIVDSTQKRYKDSIEKATNDYYPIPELTYRDSYPDILHLSACNLEGKHEKFASNVSLADFGGKLLRLYFSGNGKRELNYKVSSVKLTTKFNRSLRIWNFKKVESEDGVMLFESQIDSSATFN